jgi:HEAT repeat protein
MEVLAESQQRRVRQPLARVVASLVREHPERMLPWLGDERWYVVRNAVHILSWIGGDAVAGYLRTPSGHPEPRVRREVVAALAGASHDVARPVLMAMLPEAGGRLFSTLVQQLASEEHPLVSQRLLELLRDERFTARPEDERRAVYLALATQGDAVVPALEEELHRGGRFARGLEPHWISVARCLARIATPAARETLARGARAPRPGVRRACEQALAALEARDGR